MEFGPRSSEVLAFADSLSGLSQEAWDNSVDAAHNSFFELTEAIDASQKVAIGAASRNGLRDEYWAAEALGRDAAGLLGWRFSAAVHMGRTAAAIVVFDHVPLDDLVPPFLLFRYTPVVLPVKWAL